MNPTLEDIIQLVKVQLGSHNISPENLFIEDLRAESMELLNIICMAEDTFNVELDEAEIAKVRTVQDFYNLILSSKKG